MQLLTGPQAGVDNADRAVGLLGHLTSDLRDADRLAHFQDQRLAVTPDRRLDYQLYGLLNRHEVPGDLRIGHGDGAAARDLRGERGQHRATAAEDVAEPDAQV